MVIALYSGFPQLGPRPSRSIATSGAFTNELISLRPLKQTGDHEKSPLVAF